MYTYQQLKDKYESYLLDNFGIKWNNRTIGKYFPEHIKNLLEIIKKLLKFISLKKNCIILFISIKSINFL